MRDKSLHIIQNVGANVSRFIVGITFIFSGFVKAVDPLGFQYKLQDYLEAFGMGDLMPTVVPLFIGIFIATIEFSIGVYLFFGIRRHLATGLALLLMAFMTPLTLFLAITNPVSDCGCFGDAVVLTNWQTFGKNVFLLLLAYLAFRWRNAIISFVSSKTEWLISLYTILFVIALSFYCLIHLPIFDFRPYRIGSNIREKMTLPEGATPTIYETSFILEKDGKKKEFTLENYPDSTWTFVDTRTVVKQKGAEPAIHDFALTLQNTGEDITDSVLNNKNYTFLLVAHQLDKADDSNIDLINEIYDYTIEHGYDFFCLTSSGDDEIDAWMDKTGAEYPFVWVDNIALKTMIRSNPGLILMQDGVVLNKWNDGDLPDEYQLKNERLENIEIGTLKQVRKGRVIAYTCLWFFIPLLIVLLLDLLFVRRREIKARRLQRRNSALLERENEQKTKNENLSV